LDNKTRTPSGVKAVFAVLFLSLLFLAPALAAQAAERGLAFAVAGVVSEILVKPGQTVSAGQPLARLDLRPFAARKKAADQSLLAAGSAHKFATDSLTRVKQLFDDLSTSGEELEKAETGLFKARAGLAEAKAHAAVMAWELERATLRAARAGMVKAIPGYPGLVVNPQAQITPVVVVETP